MVVQKGVILTKARCFLENLLSYSKNLTVVWFLQSVRQIIQNWDLFDLYFKVVRYLLSILSNFSNLFKFPFYFKEINQLKLFLARWAKQSQSIKNIFHKSKWKNRRDVLTMLLLGIPRWWQIITSVNPQHDTVWRFPKPFGIGDLLPVSV